MKRWANFGITSYHYILADWRRGNEGLAFNSLIALGIRGGTLSLSFLSTWLTARLLGSANYGLYAYAMAWYGSLSLLAGFGIGQILLREVAIHSTDGNRLHIATVLRSALFLTIVIALSIGLSFVICVQTLYAYGRLTDETANVLTITAIFLLPAALIGTLSCLQQGYGHVAAAALPAQILQPLTFCIIVGVLLITSIVEATATTALAIQLITFLIALTLAIVYAIKLLLAKQIPISLTSPALATNGLLRAGGVMMIDSMATIAQNQFDIIFLGAWYGAQIVGPYQIASRLAGLLITLHAAALIPLTPRLAGHIATGNVETAQNATLRFVIFTLLPTLPLAGVFLFVPHSILRLFGNGFEDGVPILMTLSLAWIYQVATGPAHTLLLISRNERSIAFAGIVGLLTSIILNLLMVPVFGAIGAAAATSGSYVISKTIMIIDCRRLLHIDPTIWAIVRRIRTLRVEN